LRTLVVSDLHLGLRSGEDLVRTSAGVRARLLHALGGVDRLVMLGDTLELRQAPVRSVLAAAEPVLAELGRALGRGAEVLLTAGNHDHPLLDNWFARRAAGGEPPLLGLSSEVSYGEDEPLGALAHALTPARLRVAYPGVWLSEEVYATHGHYLDADTTLPTFERLGAGAMARILRRPLRAEAAAEDYEALLAPLYAWLHSNAQRGDGGARLDSGRTTLRAWDALRRDGGLRDWRSRALRAGFPVAVAACNRLGLGPLCGRLDAATLRDSSLQAFTRVLSRLQVGARYAVFGHTHRAGPLPGDDAAGSWRTAEGTALLNTGSWVHERAFVGGAAARSPYRAGFAVVVEDGKPPALVNLLDAEEGVIHTSRPRPRRA
jgi:hypothetical protein